MAHELAQEKIVSELYTKLILSDMKSKLIQAASNLLGDAIYTKEEAVLTLLDVIQLIEMEEKSTGNFYMKEILEEKQS
ncbi:hypothetical protein GI584_20185 [Gracilibacillus salitolerans]|uniref:Uncharacterized protein n=1 Tax=Gracilibacillus salitolerans TaxID=2663022 RepID=A0A5Q2TR66_9BACI|nr:hypothetical protein [Gracilibacillus salitolerans]QGH36220.1 hypothetical protein GI584_20185 [Gracilibacillus salitolerans]